MSKYLLDLKDAGSAALDNPKAFAQMQTIWQANVQQMAEYVRSRGWTVSIEPVPPVGLSTEQLDALQAQLGEPLPPQLRHMLSWARQWQFGWYCSRDDEPPSGLLDACGGHLDFSAAQLEEYDLREEMEGWIAYHCDALEDIEDEDFFENYRAFWRAHFPFARLSGGDLLTIDMRNPDPQCQPVRTFFHDLDGDSTDGALITADLFSLISGWTALACAGSEYSDWYDFMHADGGFNLQSQKAKRWLAWLTQDPNDIPAEERQPKRVPARSEADKALLLAAQAGDLEGVRTALAQGAHPDAEDLENLLNPRMYEGFGKGKTALVLAALHNNLEMLQALLDAGASLAPHELALPLLLTRTSKPANAQTLLWLIERGIRIDPWPNDRFIALSSLAESKLSQKDFQMLLGAMLAAGCNPDAGKLLLSVGPKTQQRLLDAGANPHLRDSDGMSAMHYMYWPEQPALLKAHGLDINDLSQPKDPGEAVRPLQYRLSGHYPEEIAKRVELVQTLLENGADPTLPDGQGYGAWWHCRHVACAEVLQQYLPFDPSERDKHGRTVAHHRVCYQYTLYPHDFELITWFVQHGLDINVQDNQGNTALHCLAAESARHPGSYEAAYLQVLLDQGARADITNHQGKTPLQLLKAWQRKELEALI